MDFKIFDTFGLPRELHEVIFKHEHILKMKDVFDEIRKVEHINTCEMFKDKIPRYLLINNILVGYEHDNDADALNIYERATIINQKTQWLFNFSRFHGPSNYKLIYDDVDKNKFYLVRKYKHNVLKI